MTQGIYEIVNLYDGKATVYVGSSQDIAHRWSQHRSMLRNGHHYNTHLQAAWDRDGAGAFEWSVIEEVVDVSTLIEREQHWLDCYFGGAIYNKARDANVAARGLKRSEDAKRKMSKAQMGNQNCLGREYTDETRRRISKAKMGNQCSLNYKHTDEARARMSESQKQRRAKERALWSD